MMSNTNIHIGIIAMLFLKGIGPVFVNSKVRRSTFEAADFADVIKDLAKSNNKIFDDNTIYDAVRSAEDIVLACKDQHIKIIDITSSDYPAQLRELKDAPSVIYCKGNTELLHDKTICIIGTRTPDEHGRLISERLGCFFSNSNWAICNGLAEGIDTHAIQARNQIHNKIVGVLAGGLNYNVKKTLLVKTAENAEKTLVGGGVLVSESPPDIKEDTFSVVKSCRIQAGLSHGLILVQSSITGGSRFTLKAYCGTERPFGIVYPLPDDYELQAYEANRLICEKGAKGIASFIEQKEEKIKTNVVYAIKSREDYLKFENIIEESMRPLKLL